MVREKKLEGKIADLEGKMVTLSQEKNDLALAVAAVSRSLIYTQQSMLIGCRCAFMLHSTFRRVIEVWQIKFMQHIVSLFL